MTTRNIPAKTVAIRGGSKALTLEAEMKDDIETVRAFLRPYEGDRYDAREALAALERVGANLDRLFLAERRVAVFESVMDTVKAEQQWRRLGRELHDAKGAKLRLEGKLQKAEAERDSLRAKLERAKEALEPFNRMAASWIPGKDERDEDLFPPYNLTVRDIRNASAVLSELQNLY